MQKESDQPTALPLLMHYSQPTSYLALVPQLLPLHFPGFVKYPRYTQAQHLEKHHPLMDTPTTLPAR